MAVTLPSAFRQVPRNLTYKKECVPETVIASDLPQAEEPGNLKRCAVRRLCLTAPNCTQEGVGQRRPTPHINNFVNGRCPHLPPTKSFRMSRFRNFFFNRHT
jgi:hypothetical protein